MTHKKIVSSTSKIRFQDCDPFNHLNNGKYLDYFINHREDQVAEEYKIDMHKMAKEIGKSWVTSSNQIAYLKPALVMETVYIESQLIDFTNSELTVEMRMYDEYKTYLKSVLWGNFVHFNLLKLKRETHTDVHMNLFKSINKPVKEKNFEERIFNIRTKKVELL
jgi:acyl-CoA thioester hydrolase